MKIRKQEVMTAQGKIKFQEIPIPELNGNDVLVKIGRIGKKVNNLKPSDKIKVYYSTQDKELLDIIAEQDKYIYPLLYLLMGEYSDNIKTKYSEECKIEDYIIKLYIDY